MQSTDEFGELAHDLNSFLDRINQILSDFQGTIRKMAEFNVRLASVTGSARDQLAAIENAFRTTISSGDRDELPGRDMAEDLDALVGVVFSMEARLGDHAPVSRAEMRNLCFRIRSARDE